MEWQPIETAPKDGTEIWLYDPAGVRDLRTDTFVPYMQKGFWFHGEWMMVDEQEGLCGADPTHWMPLPEPPND